MASIKKLLTRLFRLVNRIVIALLLLTFLTTVSLYTPIFSSVGLFVLNHLPIPDVSNYQHPSHTDSEHTPTAYVVLGGGLTEADKVDTSKKQPNEEDVEPTSYEPSSHEKKNAIVLNQYSLIRMQTALDHHDQLPLPIILTGVESPWMQDWLIKHDLKNIVTENASMNTCENARFTAKRLNLSDIYLITDAYHMTRARRQFALNGIYATPIVAPLPAKKGWTSPSNNFLHSRRTFYELAAYMRDLFLPQKNCRSADEVSFDTLLHSRKPEAIKTF